METNNDKMLEKFFSNGKLEIADNGFTKRVMRQLPEQPDRSWIVWTFACLGMILTMAIGFYTGSIQLVLTYFQHIPIYYFLGAISSFPLIGILGLYLIGDEKRLMI